MSYIIDEDPSATNHMHFLSGLFSLGSWQIPYFVSTLSIRDVARYLQLTKDLPGSAGVEWKVSELFQREVDWRRVEDAIVPYLRHQDQPQFFNSLTIALLPQSGTETYVPVTESDQGWHPPGLKTATASFGRKLDIGPISIGFWDDWTTPLDPGFGRGVLRWNPDEVHAVAIDGQHRLAAIREYVKQDTDATTQIPVIFLVFSPDLGYQPQGNESVLSVIRRLFIDINKHAKGLKRTRQILLDDRDPVSRCVRALLADSLHRNLSQLSETPPRIPLAIVDWHSDTAKFDDGPYISSVLQVDWMVSQALGTKALNDPTDYTAIGNQVRELAKNLDLDLAATEERLSLREESETPFSYSDEELDEIERAFRGVWSKRFVSLLTQFSPYEALLERRAGGSSLDLSWQMWFKLRSVVDKSGGLHSKRELEEFENEMRGEDPPQSVTQYRNELEAIEAMKGDSLAFKVVFQKAYFLAAVEYAKFVAGDFEGLNEWLMNEEPDFVDIDESDDFDESLDPDVAESFASEMSAAVDIENFDDFVASLNEVVERVPEFLDKGFTVSDDGVASGRLWLGSLVKAEGEIDFTSAAATRAKDVIFLSACLGHIIRNPDYEKFDFEWLEEVLEDPSGFNFFKRMSRAERRLWATSNSCAGRILSAMERDYDETAARREITQRLGELWAKLNK